jgi:hypothetical protein
MHPLRHPRNALAVGLLFALVGAVYWGVPTLGRWHVDYAGATMLVALGVAMGVLAYVLIAGSPND